MSKKKKKNSIKNLRNVNMESFLNGCYGISHEDLSGMSHQTISRFFPNLKRTSFEHIQRNPELVSSGQILLVEDAYNQAIPYIVPSPEDLQKIDILECCNEHEKATLKVKEVFGNAIRKNLDALIILEDNDFLNDPSILVHPSILKREIFTTDVVSSVFSLGGQQKGAVLTRDYELVEYDDFFGNHNRILPPLKQQAVGISNVTDAIAVVYENGILSVIQYGQEKPMSNIDDLHYYLLREFHEKKKEKIQEEEVEQEESYYTYSTMSIHELEGLMKVYKSSGQYAYYHAVRREITKRTRDSKKHRMEKEKLKNLAKEGN